MEYEGKKITKEEIKEAVQEVFRSDRVRNHNRWYETLSKQQREAVDKIFKAEVQDQLDKLEGRKIKGMTVGEVCKKTEIAEGLRAKPWWEDPESEMFKQWTKEREKMNKKNKKYKQ